MLGVAAMVVVDSLRTLSFSQFTTMNVHRQGQFTTMNVHRQGRRQPSAINPLVL